MGLLFGEVAGQAQVRYPHVAVLVQQDGRGNLEVSVDHVSPVHVLQPQDHFGGVEAHLLLREHSVLREVVVQVTP
ncbi:unnamed protein product, partial [Ixodes persulcatus]